MSGSMPNSEGGGTAIRTTLGVRVVGKISHAPNYGGRCGDQEKRGVAQIPKRKENLSRGGGAAGLSEIPKGALCLDMARA